MKNFVHFLKDHDTIKNVYLISFKLYKRQKNSRPWINSIWDEKYVSSIFLHEYV